MSAVKVAPDGGWGWIIVFGVALTNMVNMSLLSVFGLLFGGEIERMGHGTVGVALVLNMSTMVTNFSGLITGPLLKYYSCRTIAVAGVVCTSIGLLVSSFATNITQLIISYSIFTGLGFGLINPSTFMAINSYFVKRRSQVVGIAMAGTGVGQMFMPYIVSFLLDEYGYRGTVLIIAGLSLHGLIGSILLQPVEWHMKTVEIEDGERITLLTSDKIIPHQKDDSNEVDDAERDAENCEGPCSNIMRKIAKTMDLELLKDPVFIHIICGLAAVYTASTVFSMLFPLFLQESIGLNRSRTASCMAALSGADIVARLTIPLIARRLHVGNRATFLYGTLLLAFARSIIAMQTTYESMLFASIFCGYVRAAAVINQNLTISEYSDGTKLPAALGLNMVAKGIFVLSLGQFFGWIRDYYDSYTITIHVITFSMLIVVISWSTEMVLRKPSNVDVK